jgi:hypothetical protein
MDGKQPILKYITKSCTLCLKFSEYILEPLLIRADIERYYIGAHTIIVVQCDIKRKSQLLINK